MSGRYANRRDANEKDIVAELEARGFSVERMDKPVDLLIGKHGQTWIAEVKMPKGKLRPGQVKFYERWRGNELILRSVEDAAEWAASVNLCNPQKQ